MWSRAHPARVGRGNDVVEEDAEWAQQLRHIRRQSAANRIPVCPRSHGMWVSIQGFYTFNGALVKASCALMSYLLPRFVVLLSQVDLERVVGGQEAEHLAANGSPVRGHEGGAHGDPGRRGGHDRGGGPPPCPHGPARRQQTSGD